jgi:hypothetical protein
MIRVFSMCKIISMDPTNTIKRQSKFAHLTKMQRVKDNLKRLNIDLSLFIRQKLKWMIRLREVDNCFLKPRKE